MGDDSETGQVNWARVFNLFPLICQTISFGNRYRTNLKRPATQRSLHPGGRCIREFLNTARQKMRHSSREAKIGPAPGTGKYLIFSKPR
jgi:hypothetical protein